MFSWTVLSITLFITMSTVLVACLRGRRFHRHVRASYNRSSREELSAKRKTREQYKKTVQDEYKYMYHTLSGNLFTRSVQALSEEEKRELVKTFSVGPSSTLCDGVLSYQLCTLATLSNGSLPGARRFSANLSEGLNMTGGMAHLFCPGDLSRSYQNLHATLMHVADELDKKDIEQAKRMQHPPTRNVLGSDRRNPRASVKNSKLFESTKVDDISNPKETEDRNHITCVEDKCKYHNFKDSEITVTHKKGSDCVDQVTGCNSIPVQHTRRSNAKSSENVVRQTGPLYDESLNVQRDARNNVPICKTGVLLSNGFIVPATKNNSRILLSSTYSTKSLQKKEVNNLRAHETGFFDDVHIKPHTFEDLKLPKVELKKEGEIAVVGVHAKTKDAKNFVRLSPINWSGENLSLEKKEDSWC